VTGRQGGQAMLEMLERANLFLVPLDDSREWFRYHRLFAEFLPEELTPRHSDEVVLVHRRAAEWYLARDLPEPAFRHAVDGEDVALVMQIAERYFASKLFGGEFKVVERWLESLPEAWYSRHPMLVLAQVTFLIITGAFNACVRCLDEVEQRLAFVGNQDLQWQMAKVAALRCAIACFQNDLARAEMYADQALRDLPMVLRANRRCPVRKRQAPHPNPNGTTSVYRAMASEAALQRIGDAALHITVSHDAA
jgi:LuxR family maltose regulon positive regulatory protein